MESTTEWTLNLLGSEDGLRVARTKGQDLPLALIRGRQSGKMLAHLRAISAEGPLPTRWGLRLLVMDLSRQGQQILQYRNPPRLERLVILRREELIRGYWFRISPEERFRRSRNDIKQRCIQRRLMGNVTNAESGPAVLRAGAAQGLAAGARQVYSRRLMRPIHQLSQTSP